MSSKYLCGARDGWLEGVQLRMAGRCVATEWGPDSDSQAWQSPGRMVHATAWVA